MARPQIASPAKRAIEITSFDGPEALRLTEKPDPVPAAGEVLIDVSRAGINFADLHSSRGEYVKQPDLPFIPGTEVAGTRTDTGQRVVAFTGGSGGYAQRVAAPLHSTFPIPDGVDDDTALALLVQGLTAWHLHRTCARTAPGESVVVHSAAGGVGSLAVQLGKAFGAGRVIGTASSPQRRELALSLGADAAVDPAPDEGLTGRLVEANGGEPVDVAFDMAGGETFELSYRALAPFGRIVVCGISSRQPNRISTGSLLRHSRAIVGFHLSHAVRRSGPAMAELLALTREGRLRVVIGGVYPLAEAASAHRDLMSRRTSGKLLLSTDE